MNDTTDTIAEIAPNGSVPLLVWCGVRAGNVEPVPGQPVGQPCPPRQHEAPHDEQVDEDASDCTDRDYTEDQQRHPKASYSRCFRDIIARGDALHGDLDRRQQQAPPGEAVQ